MLKANQVRNSYWIKVRGLADCEPLQLFQTAILGYEGALQAQPPNDVQYDTSGPTTERLSALVQLNAHLKAFNMSFYLTILIDTFYSIFLSKTTFNPLNTLITRANLKNYTFVPQLESQLADTFNRDTLKYLCTQQADKKFYLTLDMLMVKNTDVYTPMSFWYEKKYVSKPCLFQQHHLRNANDASFEPIL